MTGNPWVEKLKEILKIFLLEQPLPLWVSID